MGFHVYDILQKATPQGQKTDRKLWGAESGMGLTVKGMIVVMVTQLFAFIDIHRTEHQKKVHFSACKYMSIKEKVAL